MKRECCSPDIIVPVLLDGNMQEIVTSIAELHQKYGFDHFMLMAPCKGWRSAGYPPLEHFRELAEQYKAVTEALKTYPVHFGWWNLLTVKSGPSPQWSPVIRKDGTASPFAACPLDPAFQQAFARSSALFAEIARPEFIILEDDYSIASASSGKGCFCPRHLAEFAKRQGKSYTREELTALFDSGTPDGEEALRAWKLLMRDSLVELSSALRGEIDRKDPQIPIGSMQSGGWDADGDATEKVTRALAGRQHAPFSRLYGAFYAGEHIEAIPAMLYHTLYSKEHLPGDFCCYYEADTYPHSRFYTSSNCMKVLLSSVFSMGFDGATFQVQQHYDNPNEECAYGRMYASERARFAAIFRAAKLCRLKGVGLPFDPMDSKHSFPHWVSGVSAFGIPYTTGESPVTFLAGSQCRMYSDEALKKLFSGTLFLDGAAAKLLEERGFAELTGVKCGENVFSGNAVYDLSCCEELLSGVCPSCRGRKMPAANVYSPGGNGTAYRLTTAGAKVLTRVRNFRQEELSPGMTYFENALGGKVIVLGSSVENNASVSLFNYRRQKLIQQLLSDCCDEFVFVRNAPKVYCIMNESVDPEQSGFTGMVTLSNLCPDALEKIALHLPPRWKNCREFLQLNGCGVWEKVPFVSTADGVEFDIPLLYASPLVLTAR